MMMSMTMMMMHRSITSHLLLRRSFLSTLTTNAPRIPGIKVNPESLGSQILPGGRLVLKKDPKTGHDRSILVERALGHFWMMNDVANTNKPVLTNTHVIPEHKAQRMTTLPNVSVLSTDETVDVPSYFVRDNRAKDASAQCTLVAISYKDYGFQLTKTWTDPFLSAFGVQNDRAKVMQLTITEGRLTKFLLSSILKSQYRTSIPLEQHDETLLCFGPNQEVLRDFNDSLRMHNTLTGYVYLLDGLGRVRFAGSGEASDDETKRMIRFARELTPRLVVQQQQVMTSSTKKKNMKNKKR